MTHSPSSVMRRILASIPSSCCLWLLVAGAVSVGDTASAQRGARPPAVPGPMLEQGTFTFDTPDLSLVLVRSSQTVAALRTKGAEPFDFTPGDLLVERSQNGYYHLGDLDLRLRTGTAGEWKSYSTAAARTPVKPIAAGNWPHVAADITPAFAADMPLRVTRAWGVEAGRLVLLFTLTNPTSAPVQIGALGIPMVFNNVLSNRSLDQAHAACVFYDPYVGLDAGYLQVARLTGRGPVLLVVPDGRTTFEAYNPIFNPQRRAAGQTPGAVAGPTGASAPGAAAAPAAQPGTPATPTAGAAQPAAPIFTDATPRSQTFEGFFDWMAHSQAFAEQEWKGAQPWNPPSMATLAPGETRTYGVALLVAPDLRSIDRTLSASGRPVAQGMPGYILPKDLDGRLFLNYGRIIRSVAVEPADALAVSRLAPTPGGWQVLGVRGRAWGRARVVVTYDDGTVQAVHYTVTKPAAEAVADLGTFLTTRQWFVDPADPFKRSPSVMTFDRETNQIVTQDSRVWIAGLGDEGGSSWLTGMMKQLGQPDKAEIDKYQAFIDQVLWGGLQHADGPRKYAVRKSLFYYEPTELPANYYRSDLNWTTWTSWKKKDAFEAVNRSYDYPHVAALHWAMYRLARNHTGLVTNHPWDWYLTNAWQTGVAMVTHASHYAQFGQMEGTVFLEILRDLKREGWTDQAAEFEARMKARADIWMKLAYPYGSEMAWDSTGQEEVYAWTKYFGDTAKAQVTLDAILGYMPTVPHWGYNGCARRYWDFLYGGKIRRIERQLHHYGSGLNAIPVLSAYRDHPDDDYLLRVGYGGAMGALANIDQEGFASAAFHAFPDTLRFDPYSGDYAQNFLGHALTAATYLVRSPEFGFQAFGGNVETAGTQVTVTPLDAFRTRVYIAPAGLWLTLDAGRIDRVTFDTATHRVRVALAPATTFTPAARLRIEQPAAVAGVGRYAPSGTFALERDAHVIPLKSSTVWVDLSPK